MQSAAFANFVKPAADVSDVQSRSVCAAMLIASAVIFPSFCVSIAVVTQVAAIPTWQVMFEGNVDKFTKFASAPVPGACISASPLPE